jgi:hypothetical protein
MCPEGKGVIFLCDLFDRILPVIQRENMGDD